MPITINLTRGRTATFPDGTSEEDITRILDEDYPLEGVDIDEMVMSDPDFEPTFEQYKLFQQHAYDKDESMLAGVGEGLEHIAGVGWDAAKELPRMAMQSSTPWGALSNVATMIESGMQGTRELAGMAAQSADPDSVFFRWKSFMESVGNATDRGRYEQFKDAREFQRRTLQMEDGRTISLSDIAQLIQKNPEAPEGVLGGLRFDFDDPHTQKRMKDLGWEKGMLPKELVNTDFVRGAKYVTDPSMLIPGLGAAGKGVSLGTKAAGTTLRGTGKVMRGAGGGIYRGGIAIGEAAEGAVKSATGVSPGIIRGGAAAVGVTTPGGQLAAGVLAGARATEAVGTVLAKAGEVMAGGPTRRGVFKQVARDLEKGTLEYALARGIGMADKPIAIAGQAAEAGIHGGLIGGGLGFMHAGPEGFGPGFGAGFGMGGTIGGAVGVGQLARGKNAFAAKTANDVLNQIKTMEPEQAAMFNEVIARDGIDVAARALVWGDFFQGRLGDADVRYYYNPNEVRGDTPLPSMTAGKPTIEINLAKLDADYTVGHEIVHGLDHIEELQPIMHQIRQEVAGMWVDGRMVEQGGMTPLALETRYVEYMHLLAKGEAKKRARRIIGKAEKQGAKLSKEEVSRIHAEEHRNALNKFMKQHSTAEKRALYVADEIMAEHMARLIKGSRSDAGLYGFDSITRRVLDRSLLKYKGTVLGGMIGRLTDWGIDPYDSMLFKNLEQAPPELNAMLRNLIRARNNLSKQIEVSDVRPDIITKRDLKHRLPELKRQGLVKQNEKGEWVLKDDKDIEATEVISETALMDILTKEDPDGFKVERIVDEKTGEVENVVTGRTFSPAQLEAINNSPAILPTVKENIGRLAKAVMDGDILNMDYYAATKTQKNRATGRYRSKYSSGIKKSNRNMLPYTLEISKAGNFFGKAIDWTVLTNDIIALASKKKLSPWGNDPRAFINDFTAYLTNLATGGKQRSFEIFGEAKADFMHDIMAKKHRGGSKYVKNFRLDRMDSITPTGERARMNPEAWDLSTKHRWMPDTGEAVQHSPREAINGKAESGTALPAMTVISPELAARFMPDVEVNDPGFARLIAGKRVFPILADRMRVGIHRTRDGKEFELRGGPDHPDIADNLGLVAWAVDGGNVSTILQKAINDTDGIALVVLQDEIAVSGNRTFGDIMIHELKYDASHGKKTSINKRINEVVKKMKEARNSDGKLTYPMLRKVKIRNLDDLALHYPDMSFALRGDIFRKVGSNNHGKTGGIYFRDVMNEVNAYQNKDGYRSGDIVKAIQFEKGDSIVDPKDIGTPVHPAYRYGVKGRSLGNVKGRLSAYQVFRSAFDAMEKEKTGRGIGSKGNIGSSAYTSLRTRAMSDPIFRQEVGSKPLAVKSYDKPLEFKADSGPKRAELAKRSEINKKLGARHMPDNAAYMKAAKKGDTDTAQRMVDQAAKAAGQVKAYHATDADFNVFGNPEIGFHFAGNPKLAINASVKGGKRNPSAKPFYLNMKNVADIEGSFGGFRARHVLEDLHKRNIIDKNEFNRAEDRYYEIEDKWESEEQFNADNASLIRDLLEKKGIDGLRYWNEFDAGLNIRGTGLDTKPDWSYIALRPSQIKSADPITRDNAGNIIPLSERFQSSSDDIRYMPDVGGQDALGMFSAAERATVNLKQETGSAAQMLAMIKRGGVKQEELAELGLDQFLEGNRKVTKDEIIDHLVENQVTVEETMLGGPNIRPKIDGDTVDTVMQRDLIPALESVGVKGSDEAARAIQKRHLYELRGEPVQRGGASLLADHAISKLEEHGHGGLLQKFFDINKLDHEEIVRPLKTKHSSYVEPGAVEGSYRELLLRLPDKSGKSPASVEAVFKEFINKASMAEAPMSMNTRDTITRWIGQRRQSAEMIRDLYDFKNSDVDVQFDVLNKFIDWRNHHVVPDYTGGHYGEHPNVLAHVRFNDRVSDHGKTLNIEEIQSDLHQEGRKKGYRTDVDPAILKKINDIKKAEDKLDSEIQARNYADDVPQHVLNADDPAALGDFIAELNRNDPRYKKREAIRNERLVLESQVAQRGTVPDAPFKTSWHELAMKRMIRYAVDNGYDAISWTKGETQFNRYGSQEIAWVRDGDGWKVKATEQRGGEAGGIDIEGAARAEGILREGGSRIASKEQLRDVIKKTVMERERGQWSPENFEKQVDKLTDRTWERMQNEDAGTSLPRKEGMEGFYDRMLPRMKTWKKLGLKVEEGSFAVPEGMIEGVDPVAAREILGEGSVPTESTHIVRLTPEVKAKVLDGGLARFMPDAAAPNTEKNQLGWSLIKGQGNKWRVYKPNGTLAGIAATKASAERMFRTKYKRELRKADK